MRPLGRSNLICCQDAHVDHMMIISTGVYTILVDFGLSLQCLVAPTGHTVILMCEILLPQR